MKKQMPTLPHHLMLSFALCAFSFSFGFFFYLVIEKIFKSLVSGSPTHWSMGFIAGLSFLFLLALDEKKLPLWVKALAGGSFITALELAAGWILNLHYRMGIWSYRDQPLNFHGQICLFYSIVWCIASLGIIGVNRLLYRFLSFAMHGKNK